ncbi:hypothetical protein F8M41_019351 [Gigaspora margarita]|uniref:Uncharacterized protein n=1 Tax=Gigaspora margarita TaxID=4874 RepID=A0A8H4B5D8_GIGMA|nr:hypothetical protein F8M41_019351 [Gigaspora margarita]
MDKNLENPIAESPIIGSPMIKSPITRSPMIKSPIVESLIEETQIEEIHLIEDQGESSLLWDTLRKHRNLLELEASLTDNSSQNSQNIESKSDMHMDKLNTQDENNNNLLQNIELVTDTHVNELNLQMIIICSKILSQVTDVPVNELNLQNDTNLLQNNITILVNLLFIVLDKSDKVLLR